MKITNFIAETELNILTKIVIENNMKITPVTRQKILNFVGEPNFINNFLTKKEKEDIILLFFGEKINIKNKFKLLLKEEDDGLIFFDETKLFIKQFFMDNIFKNPDNNNNFDFKYNVLIDKFSTFLKSKNYKYTLHRIPKMLLNDAKSTLAIDEDQIKFLYHFFFENKFIIIDKFSIINLDIDNLKSNLLSLKDKEKFNILFSYFIDIYIFKVIKGKNVITRIIQYILRTIKSFDIERSTNLMSTFFNFKDFDSIINLAIKLNFYKQENNTIIKTYNFKTEEKNIETFMYVQPNYEIITSFLTDINKRLFISEFATLQKHDTAIIYVINKNSVLSAISNKIDKEKIISFLKKESMNPVPQNIIYSIEQWANEYGVANLRKTQILECKDDFWAEKILSLNEISKYVIKRLSSTIIEVTNIHELSQYLAENNIYSQIPKIKSDENSNIKITKEKTINTEFLPSYLKKFYNSKRMVALDTENMLKVVKYAFTKDIGVEFLYQDATKKTLNNKKLHGEIIEIDDNWNNPQMIIYIEELKHDYNIDLKNITRIRPILD